MLGRVLANDPSTWVPEDTEYIALPQNKKYDYKYYKVWYIRQRYDLEFVLIPAQGETPAVTVTTEDLMWGTPLAGYVPAGYYQNKTEMIGDVKMRFAGWYADSTRQFDPFDPTAASAVMPTKDLTLFAKWVPVTYDVVIHFNIPGVDNVEQTVNYGTVLPTPTVPPNGQKTLAGWYMSESFDEGTEFLFGAGGTAITDYIVDETGTVHVYAKWANPLTYYTVEYHGANPPSDVNSYLDGGTIPLKPGRDNGSQRFIGWTLTAPSRSTTDTRTILPGTVDAIAANADAERVIHLYPVYATESQPTALLVYHANYPNGTDPTFDSSETATVVNGELAVLGLTACGFTAPGGWTFDGWNTAADGSGTKYAAGDPLAVEASGNVLYAQWKQSTISIPVTKKWDDQNDRFGKRPTSVTIHLLANGVDTGKTLVLTAAGQWTGVFTDLPTHIDGVAVRYTVTEDRVVGYKAPVITGSAATGFTVTNRLRHNPWSPQTGDHTPWLPWFGVLLVSGLALAGDALLRSRKRRYSGRHER